MPDAGKKIGSSAAGAAPFAPTAEAPTTSPAIIFVDGEEFIRCQDGDDFRALFGETVKREGGEVALVVWKPRHGIYLRERLSMTASKAEGR